jgi:hypothetical protein
VKTVKVDKIDRKSIHNSKSEIWFKKIENPWFIERFFWVSVFDRKNNFLISEKKTVTD